MAAPRFLEAEWRRMAVLNYPVDPAWVAGRLPRGLAPLLWEGRAWVSLCGLMFEGVRVFGLPLPYPRRVLEVNLRTYAAPEGDPGRAGLVFLAELVSSLPVAWGARMVQNKPYRPAPLRLALQGEAVCYEWRDSGAWAWLSAEPAGPPDAGPASAFFTEHSRAFGTSRRGETVEIAVEHPPWATCPARARFSGRPGLFGVPAEIIGPEPASAYLVDGSAVLVRRAAPLPTAAAPGRTGAP